MNKNILKASSKNNVGKILFYIFEISALVIFMIEFILAIVYGVKYGFGSFISTFVSGIVHCLIIFGIGKVIDLLAYKQYDDIDDIEKLD